MKSLDEYTLSDPIFVDANIFLVHAFADPVRGMVAKRFLNRIEEGAVRAVTSALVLNEVFFKLVQNTAARKLRQDKQPSIWNIKERLAQDEEFRHASHKPAIDYLRYLRVLMTQGLTVIEVTPDETYKALNVGRDQGLFITDATHVVAIQNRDIGNLATDDADLWNIPDVTAWAPRQIPTTDASTEQ